MREKASPRGIRVYVCGAGVGESLLLGLPGGEWGLIDCYLPSASAAAKMLAVLSKLGVNRLTFVCLTHPHYDHYSGLHYVLNEYAGRIDNIWRHPGLSARDSIARVLLAAKIRSRRNSDPEADKLADGYLKVLEAIDAATKDMPHEQYIRVVGPRLLLERKSYKLEALGPSSSLLDIVEGNIGKINTNDGCLLFSDNDDRICNSLSVVIQLTYGKSRVLFLADALDEPHAARVSLDRVAFLKLAHHGSSSGLGSKQLINKPSRKRENISCAVITPYKSSRLPREDVVVKYREACRSLYITDRDSKPTSDIVLPGLSDIVAVKWISAWVGFEIWPSGKIASIAV